jgi:hypothetical protein
MSEVRLPILNEINNKTLPIHEWLRGSSLKARTKEKIKTIPSLFWRPITTILTSLVSRRIELDTGCSRTDLQKIKLCHFPYMDYYDAKNYVNKEGKEYIFESIPNPHFRTKFIDTIISAGSVVRGKLKKTIGVVKGCVEKKIWINLLKKGYAIKFIYETGIYIPDFELQWKVFEEELQQLPDVCPLIFSDDIPGLRKLFKGLMSAYLQRGNEDQAMDVDILITGTLSKLENRLFAAEACAQGIPVMTMRHGESDGMLDEPLFGFGEQTYATHVLSYGVEAGPLRHQAKYLSPLCPEDQVIIPSNSDQYKKIYRRREIPPLREGGTWLYAPTSLSEFNTPAPFRTLPDELYLKWQEHVLNEIPESKIKLHPKGSPGDRLSSLSHKSVKGRFEAVMDVADAFIFDWISTAFTLATATDKPILYLDVGMRNLTKIAKKRISERCTVIRVESLGDVGIRDKALSVTGPRDNSNISRFSLDGSNKIRVQTLTDAVGEILN